MVHFCIKLHIKPINYLRLRFVCVQCALVKNKELTYYLWETGERRKPINQSMDEMNLVYICYSVCTRS